MVEATSRHTHIPRPELEPAYDTPYQANLPSSLAQGDLFYYFYFYFTECERHNVAFHTARDMPAVWQNARLRVLNEDVPAAALAIAHNRGFYQRHE